jgi:hypothetical protein
MGKNVSLKHTTRAADAPSHIAANTRLFPVLLIRIRLTSATMVTNLATFCFSPQSRIIVLELQKFAMVLRGKQIKFRLRNLVLYTTFIIITNCLVT